MCIEDRIVGTYGHTSLPGFHKHRTSNDFQYDVTVVGIEITVDALAGVL